MIRFLIEGIIIIGIVHVIDLVRHKLKSIREKDWREEWCSLDCWARDGQEGPCKDCPGLWRDE